MTPLSPEELATIERLKAALQQPTTATPDGVRTERFTDFPIGMNDDGTLVTVRAPAATSTFDTSTGETSTGETSTGETKP